MSFCFSALCDCYSGLQHFVLRRRLQTGGALEIDANFTVHGTRASRNEALARIGRATQKGDMGMVRTLLELLPSDLGAAELQGGGCVDYVLLIETIASLAPESEQTVIAALVPFLRHGMDPLGKAALSALQCLRAAEEEEAVDSVVGLLMQGECKPVARQSFNEGLCAFLQGVPEEGKRHAISALTALLNHSLADVCESAHFCLASICKSGGGEQKLQSAPKPLVEAALPACLRAENFFTYDPSRYNLRKLAANLLAHAGPSAGFGSFKKRSHVLEDFQAIPSVFSSFKYERRWRQCVEEDSNFLAVYEKLVTEVVCPHLHSKVGDDKEITFYYQYPPTLRLQPGPSEQSRRVHRDAEYGHQEGEVNFWMPLTYHSKTKTTLWVESEPNLGDFHPLEVDHGSIAMFHGSLCRHSVPPNESNRIRVSLDFRIGVGPFFDPAWTIPGVDHVHPRRQYTMAPASNISTFGGPFYGADKWLGGCLGSDGCVYGVPGHAEHVLKIDPKTGEAMTIGERLPGRFKWLRGILAGDGCIYCLPCWAEAVLKIIPSTGEVTTIGGPFRGQWKWHGGILANDGCIYGFPSNAERVLKVNPHTSEVTTIGGPLLGEMKWYGGALAADGCIYGIPQCAESVLRIDPSKQEVTTIGSLPPGGWKWHGGCLGSDGNIYGFPVNAASVLKIVPCTGQVTTIGGHLKSGRKREGGKYEDKYKYLGGVAAGGAVYVLPSDADHVLKIECETGEVKTIGPSFEHLKRSFNKWQNGFLASDGCIYAIPLKAESVLKIDPRTDEVTLVGGPLVGYNKWEGGVVAEDGAMYCMPMMAKNILRIAPEVP